MAARVLVLDDDEALCDLLSNELEECGYQPVCVRTADAAFELLTTSHFDVMVMDIRMPGRSGISLCAEVVGTWSELPVILMSAFGTADTAVKANACGRLRFPHQALRHRRARHGAATGRGAASAPT